MSLLRLQQRLPLILRRRPVIMLLGGLALSALPGPAAHAAGVVNQLTEAALDTALAGGGKVTFNVDGKIPITTTKHITADTTLDAAGHSVTLDGGGNRRLFSVTGYGTLYFDPSQIVLQWRPNSVNLTLNHLTLSNGKDSDPSLSPNNNNGSVIKLSAATLTVTQCNFLNNTATGGGAIFGALTTFSSGLTSATLRVGNLLDISDSVFSGNTAVTSGAAISTINNNVSVNRCAFLNNSLTNNNNNDIFNNNGNATGGAISVSSVFFIPPFFPPASDLTVTDSTFSGNSATTGGNGDARGGAIFSSDSATRLTNCTIANGFVKANGTGEGDGGGIENSGIGEATLTNTIVAKNIASTAGDNARGVFTDGGHNICSDDSFAFTEDINGKMTSDNNIDPRLGSLVYTGGGTPALELLAGSPAIDAGDDNAAAFFDQRQAPRPQGDHSDIGAYERSFWQSQAVAQGAGNSAHLLWNDNAGMLDLWNVDSSNGNVPASYVYGPYINGLDINMLPLLDVNKKPIDVWTAIDVAVGADGNQRVLWTRSSGAVVLWVVNHLTGVVIATPVYNRPANLPMMNVPQEGWTPVAISVGSDNNTRLLWRNKDGHIDLQKINDSTGVVSVSYIYGPFSGWTAVDLAVGPDGNSRILWNNVSGMIDLWSVNTITGVYTEHAYGPYPSATAPAWTATSVAVGADNNTRLLWNNLDGSIYLWNVDTSTGNVLSSYPYGSYNGWAARGITVGTDNQTRVIWNKIDGTQDLWSATSSLNSVNASQVFGPYTE